MHLKCKTLFTIRERQEKIIDIRRNIKESIVVILCAMEELGISLENVENEARMRTIIQLAGTQDDDALTDVSKHLFTFCNSLF